MADYLRQKNNYANAAADLLAALVHSGLLHKRNVAESVVEMDVWHASVVKSWLEMNDVTVTQCRRPH